jgi:hypothetical protein
MRTGFAPYVRDELAALVAEAKANYPRIIDHFPDRIEVACRTRS